MFRPFFSAKSYLQRMDSVISLRSAPEPRSKNSSKSQKLNFLAVVLSSPRYLSSPKKKTRMAAAPYYATSSEPPWGFFFEVFPVCPRYIDELWGCIRGSYSKAMIISLTPGLSFQNTPLHLATMENRPNSIALLLSMKCKLIYNSMDMSAIDYAIYFKFPEAALAMVTHEQR